MSRSPERHTSPAEHARIKVKCVSVLFYALKDIADTLPNCHLEFNMIPTTITGNIRAFHDFIIWNSIVETDKPDDWRISDIFVFTLAKMLKHKYPKLFGMNFSYTGLYNEADKYYGPMQYPKHYDGTILIGELLIQENMPISHASDYATVHIVTSRDMLQELARHRTFSFSVESTRYCNYNKRGYEFIIPRGYSWVEKSDWFTETIDNVLEKIQNRIVMKTWPDGTGCSSLPATSDDEVSCENDMMQLYVANCHYTSERYDKAILLGLKPQEARPLLPGALKTELLMTGTYDQWSAFLKLRRSPAADPQMQYLAEQIDNKIMPF
jgi:hypothetical protein